MMNDIPRVTSDSILINSLLAPSHLLQKTEPVQLQPYALMRTDSRLDDELSVAIIEFFDPPKWLQHLDQDPYGFPKRTAYGTLWRGVDTSAIDENGRTEFSRAVVGGDLNLHYAQTLAEFEDTDVNIRDRHGRTALHWACEKNLPDMVRLCLSVPGCDIDLRDNENLTAFEVSLRGAGENAAIPPLFYKIMAEMVEKRTPAPVLRVVIDTPEETKETIIHGRHRHPMVSKAMVVDKYKLDSVFYDDSVVHTTCLTEGQQIVLKTRWRRETRLGSGAFGTVWREREDRSGQVRAVKVIPRLQVNVREVEALVALQDVSLNTICSTRTQLM